MEFRLKDTKDNPVAKKLHEVESIKELIEVLKYENRWDSDRQAAIAIGVSNFTVSEIMNGKNIHDWKVLEALQEASKLPMKKILELAGRLKPDSSLPADIQLFEEWLKQAKEDDPEGYELLSKLLYAQLMSFLDKPKK